MDSPPPPSKQADRAGTSDGGSESIRDVTELYRLLVESVTDYAIFVLDFTGHIASWNPGAQRLKGYTADEIIGRHFSIFYPAEDLAAGKPDYELVVASERGRFEDEGWRLRKDGSRFWANVVITALRDKTGKLVGFAKITRDLTARRHAEEQARRLAAEQAAHAETEKRSAELSALNEQLQNQAVELEAQTEEAQSLTEDLEQANEQLEATNEALQRSLSATTFLADASRTLSESLDYEKTLRSLAQSVVPHLADWCAVDMIVHPESHAWPPQVERLAVVHQDPEKQRWGVELAERIPTDWNASTGLPHVLKDGVTEFFPRIDDDLLVAAARNPEELRLLRQVGFSSAITVPLIARGLTLGALTLVHAESARHYDEADCRLAEALAQRAAVAVDNARLFRSAESARFEAEEANKAKGQFLARMSHELRTPLNAIAGYAELLEMGLHGPLTDAQRDAVRRVQRSQKTLLGLIEDLLNFARLESGKLQYRLDNVRVNALLSGLEALVIPQLEEKGLSYECHSVDDSVTVWADPDKAEQILLNLVGNAIKFTERGKIEIGAEVEPDQVHIRVADTGSGIVASKLDVIFEPFVQGEPALTRTSHGSGLGLAISRELARAMGGDVTVASELGKGSVFTLTLRRHPEASR